MGECIANLGYCAFLRAFFLSKTTPPLSGPNPVYAPDQFVVGASIEGDADIIHNITSEIILVLPYYERGSLQDELEKRCLKENHLEETVLLRLFLCICSAVRRFHSHDPPYAHRDIKPHNILLEKDFTPILMDLGSVAPARVTIR